MNISDNVHSQTKVLVLGAYGLIGSAVVRRLCDDGYNVIGLGRNEDTARMVLPNIVWIIRDLEALDQKDDWSRILKDVDFVVNCAGALQQSANDNLDLIHDRAIAAASVACLKTGTKFIQISAVGATSNASTEFLKTKAAGDAAIKRAGIDYWIFRPGLVLAPTAYGGSALLRMLAAIPLVQPIACPDAKVQTVSLDDVAGAVSKSVGGEIPVGTLCDLVETKSHQLRDIVAAQRRWLGFKPARLEIELPNWLLNVVGVGADFLGRLGWRSPLRSSALAVLREGVEGDYAPWKRIVQADLSSMEHSLARMPARVEDRLFARANLLLPLVFGVLFVFWLFSGLIGLFNIEKAAAILFNAGWPEELAKASVIFWSAVDITIALALLVRKFAYAASWAMVAVSVMYLVSSTLFVPELWIDPLGPILKILPGIVLALFARVLLETR